MEPYAARIRAARAYAGLSQQQLAKRLGVTVGTIERREGGKLPPKYGELVAIAAICEVPPAFMEHGFAESREAEIVDRLEGLAERFDRMEAHLQGEDVNDYVRSVIIPELRSDADAAGSGVPIPPPRSEPRTQERPESRRQSRRRS